MSPPDRAHSAVSDAVEGIDRANAEDPRRHRATPLALAQGRLAEEWVIRLQPGASEALRLAARAHHLRRWELARSEYPQGRAGYLRWRRAQRERHAEDLAAILDGAGLGPDVSARAAQIVAKRGLGADPEVQVFEDAVSLTFLETELTPVLDRLNDDSKAAGIVAKTLAKMSPTGRAQVHVAAAALEPRSQRVVIEAERLFTDAARRTGEDPAGDPAEARPADARLEATLKDITTECVDVIAGQRPP